MKKTIAKFLSMILVVVMMSGILPAGQAVFAAEEETAVKTETPNDEGNNDKDSGEDKTPASKPTSAFKKDKGEETTAPASEPDDKKETPAPATSGEEDKKPSETTETEPSQPDEKETAESKTEDKSPSEKTVQPSEEEITETDRLPEASANSPRRNAELSSVSITINKPVVGENPDYTPDFPSGAKYKALSYNSSGFYKDGIKWCNAVTDSGLLPSSAFAEGCEYRFCIYLEATSGYSFSASTTATVNGMTATVSLNSNGNLFVVYDFEQTPIYIKTVSIYIDAPVIGAKPDYTAEIPSEVKYYVNKTNTGNSRNGITWIDETTSTSLDPDSGIFKAGHRYSVSLEMKCYYGINYYFYPSTKVMLNDESVAATIASSGQYLTVKYTFPERIAAVDITLDAPENGSKPDYSATFPAGVKYYSKNNSDSFVKNDISWYDVTITGFVDPNSATFQAGHQYQVYVYITANDGYFFDSHTTATVNDQNAVVTLDGKKLCVSYTFPKNSSTYSFTIEPSAFYYALENGSNPEPVIYTDSDGKCGSVELSKTTVESGDVVTITVTPKPGYTLKKVTLFSVGYAEKDITSEMKFTVGTVQPYIYVYFQQINPNTLSVAPKTAKVKYKKLKKKKQTVKRANVMNVNNAQGNVTYKLTAVKRGKSNKYKKYFSINATTGNVTIKKKLKKGTYKVTCNVTAAGDTDHSALTKTVTFTIKVK